MQKQRFFSFDMARFIALVMVICVHTLPDNYLVWVVGQPLFFTCNGIFFLLSGHFNLRERDEETLGSYYLHKVRNILLPVILYTAVTTCWNMKPQLLSDPRSVLVEYLTKLVYSNSGGHLWFVYTLFGFLLAAPFFAQMLKGMGTTARRWFLRLGMGYATCIFLMTFTDVGFGWEYPFGLWLFLFLAEPIIHPRLEACKTRTLVIGAAASLGILAMLCHLGLGDHLYDINPFYIIESFCLYELFLRLGTAVSSNAFVSLVAKHQFGMYIIHLFMKYRVEPHFFYRFPWYLSWPLTVTFTLLGSLVASIVLDAVVVRPVQALFDTVTGAKRTQKAA